MNATPLKKHWKRIASVMMAAAALLAAVGLSLWRPAAEPSPVSAATPDLQEPPEPPSPAAAVEGARTATRAVYRLEQTVHFTLDISKMLAGMDPGTRAEVTANQPRTEVVSQLKGMVEWQRVQGGEGTWVRVRWKDTGTQVSYPGSGLSAAEQAQLSEQAVKQFDGAEAYVQLDVRNRVAQVRVGSGLAPQAYPQLLNVLEKLAVTVPARPPAEWNAEEQDSFGRYNGAYSVEAQSGQELLFSKKKRYQQLTTVGSSPDGEQSLQEKHVQNLGKARIRFNLEERRLLSAEGRFRTSIRHSLMDADIDETYSLQPAPLESLASVAPPAAAELGALLASLVELNPRVALQQTQAPVAVRPGLVNLDPKQLVRKLTDTLEALRRLENFDPQSEQARPLMEDLATLFATDPELARRTLRPALSSTEKPVGGDVLSAVVSEALRHGPAGQGLAADLLTTPGLPEEGYAAALAGMGTREDLEQPGRDTLMRVLRQELSSVPPDVGANGPLLAGFQGAVAQKRDGDYEEWFTALVDELAKSPVPERQEMLLLGLGNMSDARLMAIAEPYLTSPHGHVRLAAATALRNVPDPRAMGRIFTVFLSDPSTEVRLAVVDLFNELAPLNAVLTQALQSMSAQEDAAVRKKTLAVLGFRSQSREFISQFLSDPDPNVRELAQLYLQQLQQL
ncbi:HEAT repeat domain-containing protein [Hyalangium gracile]|uniref:HEAT repeat domain-containing protein n=1 Tax=Hyalangium gracile TaxID=394092 RepID=UPI0021E184D7|nr:HEAT repeat domain-containing protein [Hyalangium gracile]